MDKERVVRARGRRVVAFAMALAVLGVLLMLPAAAKAAPPVPDITSVSPNCGPLTGNTSILINGTGFQHAEVFTVTLSIDGAPYQQTSSVPAPLGFFRVVGPTQIQATTIAHAAGNVSMTIQTSGGTDTLPAAYSYDAGCAAPTVGINNVVPSSGQAGQAISISGFGFTGMTSVTIGGLSALPVFQNDTLITATAPAGLALGAQTLTVNTNHGSASSTFTYTLTSAVTVTNVSPTCGAAFTQTSVTITGTGFIPGQTSVTFGGASGTSVTVFSGNTLTVNTPLLAAQTVDVQVNVNGNLSPNTVADNFTFGCGSGIGPFITSISPTSGPTGQLVMIFGSGFTGTTSVTFGGFGATFAVINDGRIDVTAPAGPGLGAVTVTVNEIGQTSASTFFTYTTTGLPVVTSVSPTCGPTGGGTLVTVTGSGFVPGGTTVLFGVNSGSSVSVSAGGTSLTVVSPAGAAGVVDVRVNTTAGLSIVVLADKFTYGTSVCAGPVITSLNPTSGPSTGGTSVTITGYGFLGVTSVTFGGVGATYTYYSDTQIVAVSPAGTLGTTVDVRVITPSGVSPDSTADNFTYGTAVPTVTSVSPSSGTINGGTTVTITGTGFVVGGTTVTFGGTSGTSVSVSSTTSLTVVTPAKAGGQVDVIVTTSNGSSVVTSASKYTYTGGTTSFTLSFRWTLVVWTGNDGMTVANAVSGNDGSSATNDLTTQITLVARWSPTQQKWELSFPAQAGVPGANDFTTLSKGTAYFVAIAGPGAQTWTILLG